MFFKNLKRKVSNQEQGEWGEAEACRLLKKRAFKIIQKRFYTRYGEIDLIALKNRTLYFIEVKTRTQGIYGDPLESITLKKRQHLHRAALCFLEKNHEYLRGYDWEFLAFSLERGENSQVKVEVVSFWVEG